MQVLLLTRM